MPARNDLEFEWLGGQGYSGALADRRYAFFKAQGISNWRQYYEANGGTGHLSDWLFALFGGGGGGAWTPADTDTYAWFDAADTVTLTGDPVSAWADKGSGGFNMAQPTGPQQPARSNGISAGLTSLSFVAASQQFFSTGTGIVASDIRDMFAVFLRPAAGQLMIPIGGFPGTGGYPFIWYSDNKRYSDQRAYGGTLAASWNADAGTGAYVVSVDGGTAGGDQRVRLNGTDIGASVAGVGSSNVAQNLLGARDGEYTNGEIGEVIIMNRSLSLAEREQFEGYLAWKWGLQGSLPGAHPYKNAAP